MRLDTYCRFPKCQRLGGSYAHPASLNDGGPYVLQLLALVSHTSWPHGNGHPIELQVNGGPVPEEGEHELRVVCVHEHCDRPGGREAKYRIKPEFAGAVTIAFHAVHEGHALELYWDGVRIHPPAGETQ